MSKKEWDSIILNIIFVGIIKKIDSGEPLTKSQRQILRAMDVKIIKGIPVYA